jgi:hypothetical protein
MGSSPHALLVSHQRWGYPAAKQKVEHNKTGMNISNCDHESRPYLHEGEVNPGDEEKVIRFEKK